MIQDVVHQGNLHLIHVDAAMIALKAQLYIYYRTALSGLKTCTTVYSISGETTKEGIECTKAQYGQGQFQ